MALQLGSWNAICDVCGFKFKNYELRKRWDGKMVCGHDWETRHPSDMIKVPKDDQSIPWSRPEQPDEFITVDYVADSVGTQDTTVPDGDFETNNEAI